MGIGAILAFIGGGMYVIVAAGTVFLGRRSTTPDIGRVDAQAFALPTVSGASGEPEPEAHHDPNKFEAPGTFALATAFLVLFALLYAYSWIELSEVSWVIR
ncbi:MAG: hypothetical protein R2849_00190 [Thermomicrobiales bacterium]